VCFLKSETKFSNTVCYSSVVGYEMALDLYTHTVTTTNVLLLTVASALVLRVFLNGVTDCVSVYSVIGL